MIVDRTTLADLEIFATTDGPDALFDLFDRCRTPMGSAALRRRFEAPLADAGAIREVQEAVMFAGGCGWEPACDATVLTAVSRYLNSNLETVRSTGPARHAESWWVRLRYDAAYRETEMGVRDVGRMLDYTDDLIQKFPSEPPVVIARLYRQIVEALRAPALHAVRVHPSRTPPAIFAADRVFRLDARGAVGAILSALGELDALWTMAGRCEALDLRMPEPVEADEFVLDGDGLFHLALPDGVRNPVRVTGGEVLVFVTGPNMAGKSTYLRAVGVAVLLAHIGMGVPARSLRFTPVDRLLTSLSPRDDLRRGLSYFMAEVERVRIAAEHLARGERCFMMFDEVFLGTNLHDAMDASRAVIAGFAQSRTGGFIFASHLVELVEDLQTLPSIRFMCFDGQLVAGHPVYPYTLSPGTSRQRFGMLLLEQAAVPALLEQIAVAGPAA